MIPPSGAIVPLFMAPGTTPGMGCSTARMLVRAMNLAIEFECIVTLGTHSVIWGLTSTSRLTRVILRTIKRRWSGSLSDNIRTRRLRVPKPVLQSRALLVSHQWGHSVSCDVSCSLMDLVEEDRICEKSIEVRAHDWRILEHYSLGLNEFMKLD